MSAARNARPIALAVLAATLAVPGCAGGPGAVDPQRMTDAPVAILYRDESTAMKRVDAIHDLEKRGKPSEEEGVIRVETLDAMFGGTPDAQRKLREMLGHLALFDPHSSSVKVLDGMPPGAKPLAWSPDRTKLLLAGRFRDQVQLFVWDRTSGEVEIVTSGPNEHPMGCIGPGGRLVAVETRYTAGNYEGWLMATPAGSSVGLARLTKGPSDVLPTCSPNSSLIAYTTAQEDGALTIVVLDLDAPNDAPRVVGHGQDPVFTPDGAWIVYAATAGKGNRLVRVRPDGTGRTPIGESKIDENSPAVSPDGVYVAYVAKDEDNENRERLRVRRFDGTGDRPFLTDGDAGSPAW